MFSWLEEEIGRIKTPKFHLIDGPASTELRHAVESSEFPLPPSYRQFVLQFGNAKLYRRLSYWLVEIYAGPREAENTKGEALIQFGKTDASLAYFKEELLVSGKETPVFEWQHGRGMRQTANSFEDWLRAKCMSARKRYKRKEWEAIENGPPPFTEHERAIVEARKLFDWRVIAVAANGDLRFEIHNGSSMTLPYLSVGVRGKLRSPKNGSLNGGGAYLPVGLIRPSETKIVEFDCYKKLITPEDTEVFELPEPAPEDREQYWEFR